jgi:hypothetical protein
MSSPAFLYGANSEDFSKNGLPAAFELFSNNLPPLWLALYEPADIRKIPNADVADFSALFFTSRTNVAIARLEARRDHLALALPDGAVQIHGMMVDFLKQSASLYIQCDPSQLLGIQDADDGWMETLSNILRALDAGPKQVVRKKRLFRTVEEEVFSPGWKSFFRYFPLASRSGNRESKKVFAGLLAGNADNGETPWDHDD